MPSSSNYKSLKNIGKSLGKKFKRLRETKAEKAQFFILTGVVIVSVFYLVSKWLEPYTIIDTSAIAMRDEAFIFSNLKQEALDIVAESKSCKDLVNNLEEYKHYVEDYAFKRLIIYFDYSLETPCFEEDSSFPTLVIFDIELISSRIRINDNFYGFWPPGSEPS